MKKTKQHENALKQDSFGAVLDGIGFKALGRRKMAKGINQRPLRRPSPRKGTAQ